MIFTKVFKNILLSTIKIMISTYLIKCHQNNFSFFIFSSTFFLMRENSSYKDLKWTYHPSRAWLKLWSSHLLLDLIRLKITKGIDLMMFLMLCIKISQQNFVGLLRCITFQIRPKVRWLLPPLVVSIRKSWRTRLSPSKNLCVKSKMPDLM